MLRVVRRMPRVWRWSLAWAGSLAVVAGAAFQVATLRAEEKAKERFFEMRVYTTNEGKLEALHKRFREHTNGFFKKHGMDLVGYWVPTDPERSKDTLVYILAYPDQESREKSWKAFRDDPGWKKVFEESHKDGVIVKKVDSTFLRPVDYSPIK